MPSAIFSPFSCPPSLNNVSCHASRKILGPHLSANWSWTTPGIWWATRCVICLCRRRISWHFFPFCNFFISADLDRLLRGRVRRLCADVWARGHPGPFPARVAPLPWWVPIYNCAMNSKLRFSSAISSLHFFLRFLQLSIRCRNSNSTSRIGRTRSSDELNGREWRRTFSGIIKPSPVAIPSTLPKLPFFAYLFFLFFGFQIPWKMRTHKIMPLLICPGTHFATRERCLCHFVGTRNQPIERQKIEGQNSKYQLVGYFGCRWSLNDMTLVCVCTTVACKCRQKFYFHLKHHAKFGIFTEMWFLGGGIVENIVLHYVCAAAADEEGENTI